MATWTEEMRLAASRRMSALWADPSVREAKSLAARRTASCPDCGESDVSLFYVDAKGRRTNSRCKACHKQESMRRWHGKSQVEKQATRVKALYGITPQQYLQMYEQQNGLCAICGEAPTTERGLHVDHCHTTKHVRGLLCHGCNTGIGAMREDASIMRKAISYLGG